MFAIKLYYHIGRIRPRLHLYSNQFNGHFLYKRNEKINTQYIITDDFQKKKLTKKKYLLDNINNFG